LELAERPPREYVRPPAVSLTSATLVPGRAITVFSESYGVGSKVEDSDATAAPGDNLQDLTVSDPLKPRMVASLITQAQEAFLEATKTAGQGPSPSPTPNDQWS